MHRPLLAVNELTVQYHSSSVVALERVSFTLARGEWLGVFGKSGSGKTTLARSILGLGVRGCRTIAGSIQFQDAEILGLRPSKLRQIRGRQLALIAQEPELSLNPVLSVGEQITAVLRAHVPGTASVTKQRVREMLAKVSLEDPAIFHAYPHQLS